MVTARGLPLKLLLRDPHGSRRYARRNRLSHDPSFRCKETQALFEGQTVKRFRAFAGIAERQAGAASRCADAGLFFARLRATARSAEGRPQGSTQHPRERPVARLLRLDGRGATNVEDRRLSLKEQDDEPPRRPHAPRASGEVLREDFLVPLGLSVNALSVALGVPATRIHEIVKERRSVSRGHRGPAGEILRRRCGIVAGASGQLRPEDAAHAEGDRAARPRA